MQLNNELVSIMQGREVIYAYLSDIYLYIADKKHIRLLKDILSALKEIFADNEREQSYIEQIEKYINSYINEENYDDLLDNLNHSYTRLYCLGNGVPLSESVYISPLHLTRQEAESEVSHIYNLCNFDMKHTSNEPADHISYELMFMSYLSKGVSKHIIKCNTSEASKLITLQQEFLNNHILKWIDEMCILTNKYKEAKDFYYPLTEILRSYLKADIHYLGTLELNKH